MVSVPSIITDVKRQRALRSCLGTKPRVSCYLTGMRRMAAQPALEVAANRVWWESGNWNDPGAENHDGSEVPNLSAGWSHVSIWTGRLWILLHSDSDAWPGCMPDMVTSAQQVLAGVGS